MPVELPGTGKGGYSSAPGKRDPPGQEDLSPDPSPDPLGRGLNPPAPGKGRECQVKVPDRARIPWLPALVRYAGNAEGEHDFKRKQKLQLNFSFFLSYPLFSTICGTNMWDKHMGQTYGTNM